MSQEIYPALSEPGTTRLLRLLPSQDEDVEIQCQLLNYSLRPGNKTHLYEALSYTWSGSEKPRSIYVNGHQLPVTMNLHAALSQLRNSLLERYLWVDAVCINQDDIDERGSQVQLMASIYSKANCVIVWLGEAADGSDRAFAEILDAAEESMTENSIRVFLSTKEKESKHLCILKLLHRAWFRRIWVLQEVAAARNILIMCGPDQMDSHMFCLGLEALDISYEGHPDLQNIIQTVTFLIRGSVFRCKHITERSGGATSLNIRSLGSLIDMYHTHEATVPHDKIYALLGMSTQNPRVAELVPDYKISWDQLLQKVLLFVIGKSEHAETWVENGKARINSRGYILGKVNMVKTNSSLVDRHEIYFDSNSPLAKGSGGTISIILQVSANPVQCGDLVCFLKGHSTITIIRPYQNDFSVITIAALLDNKSVKNSLFQAATALKSLKAVPRCLRLIWDIEKTLPNAKYGHKFAGRPASTENTITSLADTLEKSTSLQDSAWIFADTNDYREAVARYEEATRIISLAFGEEHPRTLEGKVTLVILYMKTKWVSAESLLLSVAKVNQTVKVTEDAMLSVTMERLPRLRALGEKLIMIIRLLEPRENTDKITHEEVLYIIKHFDEQWVTLLLGGRWGKIPITNSVLVAAAQNKRNGTGDDILSLILQNSSVELEMTEAVVVACCRNTHRGEKLMKLLLDSWEDSLPVTEKVVSAAAESPNTSIMELLFKRKQDLQITAKVMEAAATSSCGIHMFDLIRHERGEFAVTEAMVNAAACNPLSGLGLLEYFGGLGVNELSVTEKTLIAAAGNPDEEIIEYLLKKARKGNLVSGAVLKEAAGNLTQGFSIMKILLQAKQGDVTITEDVIEAAARSQPHARMLELLLHHDGPDPRVTENVLCAAAACKVKSGEKGQFHQDSLQFLLARKGEGVPITERLIQTVSKNEQYDERVVTMLRQGDTIIY